MVREQVCPDKPYAIGLRLGADAARKLRNPDELKIFQKWLDEKNCYVFTINGFPYGAFHGTRVKEQVYRPDWTTSDRLEYTILLFEILEALLQPGQEGSVSTLPGSFKEFISPDSIPDILFDHLLECSRSIEQLKNPSNSTSTLDWNRNHLDYSKPARKVSISSTLSGKGQMRSRF